MSARRTGCIVLLGLFLACFVTIWLLIAMNYKPLAQAETDASSPSVTTGAEYADKPPAQWFNGDSVFIDDAIKRRLRDPDSYQFDHATAFIRTSVDDASFWLSEVDFRAKNGFGGYNREHMLVVVEDDGTDLAFENSDQIRALFGKPKVKHERKHSH